MTTTNNRLSKISKATKVSTLSKATLKELQTALSHPSIALYNTSDIDGDYGPKTQTAWTAFKRLKKQKDFELIGPGSIKLLLNDIAPSSKPKLSTTDLLAARVVEVCEARGYELDRRAGATNIFAIEGFSSKTLSKITDTPDRWNDSIGILTFDTSGSPKILCLYEGTTEPGAYYTRNPLNRNGAARLQLGFHKNLWSLGLHRGYEALSQVGTATLVRDLNENGKRDDKVSRETNNGINLHTTKTTGWRGAFNDFVGQWSAGCVVIKAPNNFKNFIQLLKEGLQYKSLGRRATYNFILLWQDWI